MKPSLYQIVTSLRIIRSMKRNRPVLVVVTTDENPEPRRVLLSEAMWLPRGTR